MISWINKLLLVSSVYEETLVQICLIHISANSNVQLS